MDYEKAANHWLVKDQESVHMEPEALKERIEQFIKGHKKIPLEAMKKLPQPMNLIKITPTSYDYLDSDLKKAGFGVRQHV